MKDLVLRETMVLSRLESQIQSFSRKRRHDSQIFKQENGLICEFAMTQFAEELNSSVVCLSGFISITYIQVI